MTQSENSPLQHTVTHHPTDYWNDSCSIEELTYAIHHGAVGATTNPSIVLNVLKQEMHLWQDRIEAIIAENPAWSESQITWKLVEEMAVYGARLLEPAYHRHQGKKGRLSIQTNPVNFRSAERLVAQAVHFSRLAPNIQVKLPATLAGIQAIEEATFQGVSINATVNFTVPQALAVAEAVELGLTRREKAGLDIASMSPVCTIMIGRNDDWMGVFARREQIDIDPSFLAWAGIATFKKAYGIFRKRGYRSRLLAAAYRHLGHWSELIGGDIVLTIPYEWARKINSSDIPVISRIEAATPSECVRALYSKIPDFRRAYDEDGLRPEEFDGFGATIRTLRSFIESVHDLNALVRDFMLPNPDLKR